MPGIRHGVMLGVVAPGGRLAGDPSWHLAGEGIRCAS